MTSFICWVRHWFISPWMMYVGNGTVTRLYRCRRCGKKWETKR